MPEISMINTNKGFNQVLLTAIALVLYIYQLVLMQQIDISQPVVETKHHLARLKFSTLWIARILFLQLPVWTTFYTGNLFDLVKKLKSEKGKNIYCDGGAEVINGLLKHDLIDEFIISVIPVLLGNGTRLFKDGRPEQTLEFVKAKTFETGFAQLHYKRKK